MHSDYHIEDLVYQNENLVVYRVHTSDGTTLALVRLKYEENILNLLKGERFDNALKELQSLSHSCLRPVLDGGLDPVDSHPWLAVRWWDGILLTDRIKKGPILTQEEFDRIKNHGSNLVETLGPVASTVSFTPESVVTCGTDPTQLIDTFSVDYHAWFHAFAQDVHPASLSASYQKLADLLERLRRHTAHTPATLVTSDLAPTTHRSTLTHAPSTLSNPSSTVLLPSATKSSFPLKTLLLVSALLISIGAGFWFMTQKPKEKPQEIAKSPNSSPTPKRTFLKKTPEATTATTAEEEQERPERPTLDIGHVKIDASDAPKLKKNIGKWVQISGDISELNSEERLIFDKSALLVSLPPSSQTTAENAVGNTVSIQGFLESATLLDVQDQADINISYPPKEVYSVKDEAQLRDMKGEVVSVAAEAIDFTTSKTKATLYLQLHNRSPEFAIGFQKSKLEDGLDEAYIRSLIGKNMRYKGPIRVDTHGHRLSIVVTKKSQITAAE